MRQVDHKNWSREALFNAGYAGSFQVEYNNRIMIGNCLCGPIFWVSRKKMLEGVSLDELDRVYHPFDRDRIQRMRSEIFGQGGQHHIQFRAKNQFSEGYSLFQAIFNVEADAFGRPLTAEGVLFEMRPIIRREKDSRYKDMFAIVRHLKEAKRLTFSNSMTHLSEAIGNVLNMAEVVTINRILE